MLSNCRGQSNHCILVRYITRTAICELVQIIYLNYSIRKIFNVPSITGLHSLSKEISIMFRALSLVGKKKSSQWKRRDPETGCGIYAPFRGFFRVTSRLASTRSTLFRFDDIRNLLPAISSPVATCLKLGPRRIGYRARFTATRMEEGEIKCIGTIYAPGLTFSRCVTYDHPSRHRSP